MKTLKCAHGRRYAAIIWRIRIDYYDLWFKEYCRPEVSWQKKF